ncbi:MAG: aminotransferase class V-fold PLP-dependent enzyme, partial [Chitinophagales bacterium]
IYFMNIDALRNDTPGCRTKIHFNNAGCSLHPQPVVDTVINYLKQESLTGGYELAAEKADEINGFYSSAATLFNCKPENIAFVNNATDGFSKALSSIRFKKDDVILTTINDYVSNQIQFLSLEKRYGIKIIRAENTEAGEVDVESVHKNILKHQPVLVSVTHVPNNTGLIQPVEQVGKICHDENILFAVDGCQSAGQLNVDLEKIQCDFFSSSMRKFMRGPRGGGFLYVSDKVLNLGLEPLFIDMTGADWVGENIYRPRADAKRFEFTEVSYAIMLGAKAAMDYILNIGITEIEKRNAELSAYARNQFALIPGTRLLDKGSKLSSIISLTADGVDIMELKDTLIKNNINLGAAVKKFALLDFQNKKAESALRISPHYYNTFEEVDMVAYALKQALHQTAV